MGSKAKDIESHYDYVDKMVYDFSTYHKLKELPGELQTKSGNCGFANTRKLMNVLLYLLASDEEENGSLS